MMKKRKMAIGIVGCGAIGSSLAREISVNLKKQARLRAIYDIDKRKSSVLAKKLSLAKSVTVGSLDALLKRCRLVIEAASAQSSWNISRRSLQAGCDVMIMSVGGVAPRINRLRNLAGLYGASVYIPSGAVCGIDGLKAVFTSVGGEVLLTTRKHPASFRGVSYIANKGIDLGKIKKDTVLFYGSARRAIKLFPRNINVAAVLSLAGAGLDKTKVRIIASPRAMANVHEVSIKSDAAVISARAQNILHPQNPKTSYLAVLSAIATLRQILQPVKIGT